MIVATLAACGPSITLDGEDDAGTTGTTGTSTASSTSASPPSPPAPATTSAGEGTTTAASTTTGPPPTDDTSTLDDGCAFTDCLPDAGREPFECDLFAQDCPEGEKCMPWANDGGSAWNAVRCSPIAADPAQVGDPCTVEGSGVSGIDDCDIGLMCWSVDDENAGYCEDLCTGSAEAPQCEDSGDVCIISNDGAIVLCLATCQPLAGDCVDGEICYPHSDVGWVCGPAGRTAGLGEPCRYDGACDSGLGCVPANELTACDGAVGCCTPYCDLDDLMADATCQGFDPTHTCQPWYAAGQAPSGYESLGACKLAE